MHKRMKRGKKMLKKERKVCWKQEESMSTAHLSHCGQGYVMNLLQLVTRDPITVEVVTQKHSPPYQHTDRAVISCASLQHNLTPKHTYTNTERCILNSLL